MSTSDHGTKRGRAARLLAVAGALIGAVALPLIVTAPAEAAACSTSSASSPCTVNTSTTVQAGTLGLEHSPNLYWKIAQTGYDQFASGSASALGTCTGGSSGTTCAGGTAPVLQVLDATGAGSGWGLSAYVTSSNLPTGSVLTFNGAGSSTIGNSTVSPIATNPFAATTPATVCDYGSSCTNATAATSGCTSRDGHTGCATYAANLLAANAIGNQVNLYSATASTGLGAMCFASGTATAAGCASTTSKAFYNLGVRSDAAAGSYTGAVINLTVSSGP